MSSIACSFQSFSRCIAPNRISSATTPAKAMYTWARRVVVATLKVNGIGEIGKESLRVHRDDSHTSAQPRAEPHRSLLAEGYGYDLQGRLSRQHFRRRDDDPLFPGSHRPRGLRDSPLLARL